MRDPAPALQKSLDALKAAIKGEVKGHEFYTQAAKKTSSPSGQAMFEQLAKDEVDHQRWLEELYESLSQGVEGLSPRHKITHKPIDKKMKPVTPIDRRRLAKKVKERTEEVEAVLIGIKLEEDAIAFYQEAMDQPDLHQELKDLFGQLIEFEESHRLLLQAEYQVLTGVPFYYDYPELSKEVET
jgi:rubrerythrin